MKEILKQVAIIIGSLIIVIVGLVILLNYNNLKGEEYNLSIFKIAMRISRGLEAYAYGHNGQFPQTLNALDKTYFDFTNFDIKNIPQRNIGKCATEDNNFKYTRTSTTTYIFYFCLSKDTVGYPSGLRQLTPDGIN